MRIVVTGALGHIGSRLVRRIPEQLSDVEISLVDNFSTQRYCSLFELPRNTRFHFYEMDARNPDIQKLIDQADIVVHLAAYTDAVKSAIDPSTTIEHNVSCTLNLVKACAAASVRLIHVSSTSVYGSQRAVVDESCTQSELIPQSPYAEAKLLEEQAIRKSVQDDSLRAISLRFGTVFGVSPGIRFHTAVNKFAFQAATRQSLTVWRTAMKQMRPYLHVDDAADAIIHVIKRDLFDVAVYNVLSQNSTVSDILDIIREEIDSPKIEYIENQIMNQLSYSVDDIRFRHTGFVSKGTIRGGIQDILRLLSHV